VRPFRFSSCGFSPQRRPSALSSSTFVADFCLPPTFPTFYLIRGPLPSVALFSLPLPVQALSACLYRLIFFHPILVRSPLPTPRRPSLCLRNRSFITFPRRIPERGCRCSEERSSPFPPFPEARLPVWKPSIVEYGLPFPLFFPRFFFMGLLVPRPFALFSSPGDLSLYASLFSLASLFSFRRA